MTDDYYTSKLSSNKLKQCYDIASPRVIEYLEAEIEKVLSHIKPHDDVLELGCGYGRVLDTLLQAARAVVGIDTSKDSLELAKVALRTKPRIHLSLMDARTLGFHDSVFDKTICIQNGISAFNIEPRNLVKESIRVTRDGGICLFSSYSDRFWEHRLDWFRKQSEENLLGEIDWEETRNGVIVCKDGFRATTFREDDFKTLSASLGLDAEIVEVDHSSVFCIIKVEK
ncbi:MAG: Ubiquinone/menaquinone biosynthesis C-methyltransferase UbiE [Candidatus Thorarchaeota archaeon AB_25]|nr:MAG: Ubiquinone/menaquinone biosynthesis C-methyltransferase UbiE [Candidatus Thorarchaeota archaeon AB_25]